MNKPQWFRVGPAETEAYYGPLLARMRPAPNDSVWFDMAVFRDGVWLHTMHATRAKLKKSFLEECERYELEQDRARLDWIESQCMDGCPVGMIEFDGHLIHVWGGVNDCQTLRQAIDAAMREQSASAANVGAMARAEGEAGQ